MSESQPTIHKRPSALTSKNSVLMLGWLSTILLLIPANASAITINAGSLITGTSQGESDKIAVILSQGCITSEKNHAKTSCPTYKDLAIYDNTTKGFFGNIINDTNGFYHRSKVMMPMYYNVLHANHWVVAVDPPDQFLEAPQTKTITIMAPGTLSGYTNPNQAIGSNHTRTEYHDRYVDGTCTEVKIAYTPELYKDTISFMESGCTKTTFSTETIKHTNNSPITYNNPTSSLHLISYLKQIMHNHSFFNSYNGTNAGGLGPSNCLQHQCNYTDPYVKIGYK